MAFVKELVSEEDRVLYNSFAVYDYDHQCVHECHAHGTWLADREREIYFFYVSGGMLEHPEQYDLIWQGKTVVLFIEATISRIPLENNPIHLKCEYDVISVRAPKEFQDCREEMIDLIKEVLTSYHAVNIIKGIPRENRNCMVIRHIAEPQFLDKVR